MLFGYLHIFAALVLCVRGARHQGFTADVLNLDHTNHGGGTNLTPGILSSDAGKEKVFGSVSLAQTAFEVRKLFLLGQAGRSDASDPYVLASAVAISTVANIATVMVSQTRVNGLKSALQTLESIQNEMFHDHDSECFNVRALEVQADLWCRGVEALSTFARQELLSKAAKITVIPSIPAASTAQSTPASPALTASSSKGLQNGQSTRGASACCCRKIKPSDSCRQKKDGLFHNYLQVKSNGIHFCCKNQTKATCSGGTTIFGHNKYQQNLQDLELQGTYDSFCLKQSQSPAVSGSKTHTEAATTTTTKMSDIVSHDEGAWNSFITSMWRRMPWGKPKHKPGTSSSLESLTEDDLHDAQDDVAALAPAMLQSGALDPEMQQALETIREKSARALEALTKNVRRAMGSAVHSACHTFEEGELVLQTGIRSLELRLKDAQDQTLQTVMELVSHLTLLFVLIPRPAPLASTGSSPAYGTVALALAIETAQAIVVALSNPNVATFECFPSAYRPVLRATSSGLARLLNIVVALSSSANMMTITLLTATVVVNILSAMNEAFGWISTVASSTACEAMEFEMLDFVDSSIAVISLVDGFFSLMGGPVATILLAHALVLLDTLQSLLKMSKAVLELQNDKSEISEVTAAAKSSRVSSKLRRSFETCTALSTAWSLSRTAADLVIPFESLLLNLPGHEETFARAKRRAFEDLIAYRPGVARTVLSRALRYGYAGIDPELVERAKMLAENAPISDLAMTKQFHKGFRRLGFTELQAGGRSHPPTNFFVCRGCASTVILGIVAVESPAHSEQLAIAFKESPPRFLLGEERYMSVPEGSTLSFVHVQFEADLRMIAFVKAPLATLEGRQEILFELKFNKLEMTLGTGIMKGLRRKDAEAWQADVRRMLKESGTRIVFSESSYTRSDHWTVGAGSLKATDLRWLGSSFMDVLVSRNIANMVPSYRLRPLQYLTVTRGCGCVVGQLTDTKSETASTANIHHLMQMKVSANSNVETKWLCDRWDMWLSSQTFTLPPELFSQTNGLQCDFSLMPTQLGIPIPASTSLANENDEKKGQLIYDSLLAEEGPAGRYVLLNLGEDGSEMGIHYFLTDIAEVPQNQLSPQEFSSAIRNFQSSLSKILCSRSCSFVDAHSAEEAVARTLNLDLSSSPGDYIERYVSLSSLEFYGMSCTSPRNSELWHYHSMQSSQSLSYVIGSLRVGSRLDDTLGDVTVKVFENSCDYHAVYLVRPAWCPADQFPQLVVKDDLILEACVSTSSAMPVRLYAISLDFNYHEEALNTPETQTEDVLLGNGMVHWPAGKALWSDERFTSFINSERSIRQRIYVLYDPRVQAFPNKEVCPTN